MRWSEWFKRRKRQSVEQQAYETARRLLPMIEPLNRIDELVRLAERNDTVQTQLAKLGKLQYKSVESVQQKLDQSLQLLQVMKAAEDEKKQSLNGVIAELLRWLDDMDHLVAGLDNQDREVWGNIFSAWSSQLITLLDQLGVREIQVLGETFDPTKAVSMQSIPKRQETDRPYDVAQVIRRGFAYADGTLFRKASVITVKGDT